MENFIEQMRRLEKIGALAPVTEQTFATPAPATTTAQKYVPYKDVAGILHELESARGKHPDTAPGNVTRSGVIPAANGNQKDRPYSYRVGYAGEYGLTPDGISELLKSKINRQGKANKKGYMEFINRYNVKDLQDSFSTNKDRTGLYAAEYLFGGTPTTTPMTAKDLASAYMDRYLRKEKSPGVPNPNYNEANRARVLKEFQKYEQ